VLDFIHISAAGVAEIAKSTHLKGCPHTFGDVLHVSGRTRKDRNCLPRNLASIVMHGASGPQCCYGDSKGIIKRKLSVDSK
jgi:hypothetical protein